MIPLSFYLLSTAVVWVLLVVVVVDGVCGWGGVSGEKGRRIVVGG